MKKANHVRSAVHTKKRASGGGVVVINLRAAFLPDATKFYLNISSSPSLHTNEKKWLKRLQSASYGRKARALGRRIGRLLSHTKAPNWLRYSHLYRFFSSRPSIRLIVILWRAIYSNTLRSVSLLRFFPIFWPFIGKNSVIYFHEWEITAELWGRKV